MSRVRVVASILVLSSAFLVLAPAPSRARAPQPIFGPPASAQRVASADGSWDVLPPFHREYPSMVYDPVRDRMLEFGGYVEGGETQARNQVWALSLGASQAWTLVPTVGTPPPPTYGPSMIYDPVRDQLVVFGGVSDVDGTAPTDVWMLSLTGTPTWTRVTPLGGPPVGRVLFGAVYDPARDRMLVFGGQSTASFTGLNDVWALQLGASPTWTQLAPTGTPPAGRFGFTMVYDSALDQLVIFGGHTIGAGSTSLNDTWTLSLSGTPAWTKLAPSGTPPGRRLYASSIYDPLRDRVLVFAGYFAVPLNDLWSLTLGASPAWTQLTPASPPSPRLDAVTVLDPVRQQMVSFGGQVNGDDDLVMLALSGPLAWTASSIPSLRPDGYEQSTAIVDPLAGRMLVFGGGNSNSVWQLPLPGPPVWTRVVVAGTPPPGREGHSAILDPVRLRMIAFGGFVASSNTKLNDLWALTLTGTPTWTALTPLGTPPTPREGHSATYDPGGDRMIVFGGSVGAPAVDVNELWALSLSGTPTWAPLAASGTPPSPRSFHSAVYDAPNNRIVFFGGTSGPTYLNDTWALTLGASPAWTQLTPAGAPPNPRGAHTAVVDEVRDRMLVFSGTGNFSPPNLYGNDVWALSLGASPTWTPLATTGTWPPDVRTGACAIYDPGLDRMIAFGGDCPYSFGRSDNTWVLTFGDLATPTEVALVDESATPDAVTLHWYGAGGAGLPATVQRRTTTSDWVALASISGDGTGRFTYVDPTVTPGTHYDYRLAMVESGVQRFVGQAGVDVPARAALALRGFAANPAEGAASIAFTLPDGSPARLEMFDVRGRRVLSEDVSGLGAGAHVVPAGALAPGVYWVRLSRGGRTLSARGVLLR